MRAFINALCIAHCAVVTLALAYTVGALLGLAVGAVALGKTLGVMIGVIALLGWWRAPEPWRIERYYAIKHSCMRGDLVTRTGYGSPGEFVLAGFAVVVVGAAILGGLTWLLN